MTTEEQIRYRATNKYINLIKYVLKRDSFTCQCCNAKNTKLNVHHLDGYNWCIEKRTDPNNCITLCKNCHDTFHSVYGKGNNTKQQFEEWYGDVIEIIQTQGKLPQLTFKVYCLENNKVYESTKECQKDLKIADIGEITKCCSNHPILGNNPKIPYFQTNGYHLFWKNDFDALSEQELNDFLEQEKSKGTRQKVICVTTTKAYPSIVDVLKDYPFVNRSEISACCRGRSCSAGKLSDGTPLVWMYYSDYLDKINNNEEPIIRKARQRKPVICITTNKIFESITEASNHYQIDGSGIGKNCRKIYNTYGKLKDGTPLVWMYYDEYEKGV